ncbi:MAG: ATP-binding protein [Bacteroidota bacterium]
MLNQKLNAEISEVKVHFEQIFNTSPDAVVISRLSDGMFVECNEGFTKISGYTKKEILDKSSLDINIWKNPSDRFEVVKMIKIKGSYENFEFPFQRKGGEVITGLMSGKILTLKGIPHIISVTRDISDRKIADQVIKLKNEELIKLNLEKDKFFSIIAHDLRGPFSGFLGQTQIMAEDSHSLTMLEVKEFAVSLNKSADSLYRLLNNLLEWSQIQKGSVVFTPAAIQLRSLVDESMVMIIESAKTKGIEINYDIRDDITVFADNNILQTVIRNLVSNAVKFTPRNGKIDLSAKTLSDKSIEICVRDSGIGINPSMVDDLFRLDVQTNRKGTEGEPSSGLGLLLCKEFIEKHGGKIWVESEEGIGSAFYFTLPYHVKPEEKFLTKNAIPDDGAERKMNPEVAGLKILIVEDDKASEILISKMVEMVGREILKVRTGIEAVEACHNNPDLNLILMDIQMPGLNGYEATRQIRQFNKNVVIIAQTAYAQTGDREKSIAEGCNDYIAKPILKDELLALIQKYFKE